VLTVAFGAYGFARLARRPTSETTTTPAEQP
jgi:hypothetical protein